ncbi:MAG: thioredoxin domain-containing protein [Terriglobia bacterium]
MRKTLLLALSLVGLFDSSYLWWVYASPSRPMVCLGSGCDEVRASVFAYPAGIPMPVFGVVMYAALLVLIFAEPLLSATLARWGRWAVAGISGLGFLFSLYLTGVEAFVLHAWCAWCVVSAIAVTLIFALAVFDLLRPVALPEASDALATLRRHAAVCVASVVIGTPAFILLARSGTPPPPNIAAPEVLRERLVRPDSHMTGNLAAPVTVVEFGDFECPACGRAEEGVREIRQQYGDQVRFVFRQFPLERIHIFALKAAQASECAADQGKFWEAVDKLYAKQLDLSEPALIDYAGELGLDVPRFTQCLRSGATLPRIQRDVEDAHALGVDRTPTFFVGRQRIIGALDPKQFPQLLEQERAAAAGAPRAVAANSQPSGAADPGAGSLGAGGFGNPGAFGQFQSDAAGCSEADALKQQPALIHTPEVKQLFGDGGKTVFVDVRDPKEFKTGRIPKAVNIPADKIAARLSELPKERNIVLYESGRASGSDICAAGRAAGRTLLSHGFPFDHIKVYQDGLAAWEKAGLPVER